MRRTAELQSFSIPAMTTKALGKLPKKDNSMRGENDHQMELDEQLQRESRPPTLPPISVSEPLGCDPTLMLSATQGADDDMDTSSDSLTSTRAKSDSNSTLLTQHSLLTQALEYGRELNAEFSHDTRPAVRQALNDTFALIAYTDARDSVVGGLMEGKGRVEIAEEVNAAILGTNKHLLRFLKCCTNGTSSVTREAVIGGVGEIMCSD